MLQSHIMEQWLIKIIVRQKYSITEIYRNNLENKQKIKGKAMLWLLVISRPDTESARNILLLAPSL